MFGLRKVHKIAGLVAGIILFVLALTGIVLDHDEWKVSYRLSLPASWFSPDTVRAERRLINYYDYNASQERHLLAGYRGVYLKEGPRPYRRVSDIAVTAVAKCANRYYAATLDGIWYADLSGKSWHPFALEGTWITSIGCYREGVIAVAQKREIVLLDPDGSVSYKIPVRLSSAQTAHDITLSRFVRDVHYGRGIFDDGWSLWWNDAAAVWLMFLALSGYLLFWMIRRIRFKKELKTKLRNILRWHASSVVWAVALPLVLLALTGIVLDHAGDLSSMLKRIHIPHHILPPVYRTLHEDIWAVDYDKGVFRIGTRYGVYRSNDLKRWALESPGFAYRMIRQDNLLYVSGMGAPSRIFDKAGWRIPSSMPRMFRSVTVKDGKRVFFTSRSAYVVWPTFDSVSLYTLAFTAHDGTLFASWWKWVNDIAAVLLLILLYTGGRLWYKRIRRRFS